MTILTAPAGRLADHVVTLRLPTAATSRNSPCCACGSSSKSICGSPAWRETGLPECYGFVKAQAFAESRGMVW